MKYSTPDLGGLYNRAAQYHRPDRNPIVVIPGLMGSTLEDSESGTVVWGAFTGQTAKPGKPEGARLIAHPMSRGVPLEQLRDEVVATRVLDKVKVKLLGLPLHLKAYFQLLGTLGAGGYRDEDLGVLGGIDYGEGHFTCFQFPYDWRRDLAENARLLHEFLLEKQVYVQGEVDERFGIAGAEVKFDLVTHSLGGLVARYYLRYGTADVGMEGELPQISWAGADLVERAVLVAPPNGGTVEAVKILVDGRSFGGPFVPNYPAALLGTFPVGYQMLPRPRTDAVVIAGTRHEPVGDLFDPELWQRFQWGLADPQQDELLQWLLPGVDDAAERRAIALDHQAKALHRARRITRALDQPATPPPGLDLYLVAGDSEPTPSRLAVVTEEGKSRGRIRVIDHGPGDGTVLRSSALLDQRADDASWQPVLDSPISWTQSLFLFQDHLGLTKDRAFTDNVLFWLLEEPRRHREITAGGLADRP